MKYIDVIVDNNTDATDVLYTYSTELDDIRPGQKVIVPFTIHNKNTEGYVARVLDGAPEGIKRIKQITEAVSGTDLSEEAMQTALWMRDRFLCRYIEAVKCFLPVSEVKRKTKDPFEAVEAEPSQPKDLTAPQAEALSKISAAVRSRENRIFLLHGVTGSGKTEVYLQAMKSVIDEGRQGIIMVPEISLTPQLVSRFMSRFGKGSVAVLHSKLTPAQRSEQYRRIKNGEVSLVIGARSAIFAPAQSIGLIVMDEEHETSYKSDKSPKYDTLELAEKRAKAHGAPVVLGSATPSVTDFYRSEIGLFTRLTLPERYNSNPMPKAEIVDMTAEIRAGNRSLFSKKLAEGIRDCMDHDKQVILFLNRRGYSSFVSCRECGHTLRCPECGIAMTYHRAERSMVCHYCGRKQPVPSVCPKCGSKVIGRFGAGTEQVEEKVRELFPDASAARLDLDTIKRKGQMESVLKAFEKGKTDILIGTQLVAKGLDFAGVGLVGIISADVTLNVPDFRSCERTFQLVTQAAGRAGRGEAPGRVIIQTYNPGSQALICAARHDYRGFYDREIELRKASAYPPFSDIYQLVLQDADDDTAFDAARRCALWLRRKLPENVHVLGPAPGVLVKEGGMFRYQLLIKSPAGARKTTSLAVRALRETYAKQKGVAQLLTVDINPFSFL